MPHVMNAQRDAATMRGLFNGALLMTPTDEKTTLMSRIVRWTENNPITVLAMLVFSATSTIVSVTLDVIDLKAKTHSYYGAVELADQYFGAIAMASMSEARELSRKLVALSVLSTSYNIADNIIEKEQNKLGFLSSNVQIGFEPDQVVYARDPISTAQAWSFRGTPRPADGRMVRLARGHGEVALDWVGSWARPSVLGRDTCL